jgi:2-keto-4-pentenoate hydratase/2-oxohepta-3-ene-1,7-dioic acid hydratase in catechol pathway
MKFSRFIDDLGVQRFGTPAPEGSLAELCDGDPYTGLKPTGQMVNIRKWLPPIDPVNIFGIGLNYRAHAEETGARIPETPVVFMKPTSAVSQHLADIHLPASCEHGPEVDYEAELAVVIGKAARDVSLKDALKHVLGYTCANDVSARRWQKHGGGGQWVRGKGFDTFCPLGPVLVTTDTLPDPQALAIQCRLNGTEMQNGSTSDMIFSVAELISRLSRDTTLLPGTLILTGTPPGVGYARQPPVFLKAGDEIEVEIDLIGTLHNSVTQS